MQRPSVSLPTQVRMAAYNITRGGLFRAISSDFRWMQSPTEGANLDRNEPQNPKQKAHAILAQEQTKTDLSEVIAENFGANATYVETLLARWRSDPALVDESWRAYFAELVGEPVVSEFPKAGDIVSPQADGDGAAAAAKPARAKAKVSEPPADRGPQAGSPLGMVDAGGPELRTETVPIRGAALKIVENMEASLAVPIATSQRRIPVKLLDENRRLINRHLSDQGGRKASYTHLIAWAIVRALAGFPQ